MWAVGALRWEPAGDDADLLPAVLVPFAHTEALGPFSSLLRQSPRDDATSPCLLVLFTFVIPFSNSIRHCRLSLVLQQFTGDAEAFSLTGSFFPGASCKERRDHHPLRYNRRPPQGDLCAPPHFFMGTIINTNIA